MLATSSNLGGFTEQTSEYNVVISLTPSINRLRPVAEGIMFKDLVSELYKNVRVGVSSPGGGGRKARGATF